MRHVQPAIKTHIVPKPGPRDGLAKEDRNNLRLLISPRANHCGRWWVVDGDMVGRGRGGSGEVRARMRVGLLPGILSV